MELMLSKYKVVIIIDDSEWNEYIIIAANDTTAAFLAGIKFREEESIKAYQVFEIQVDSVML